MDRKVKICGISTIEAMDAALENQADMIGLVFFDRSPRNVSLDRAKQLANHARGKTKIVALTVDASDELLKQITEFVMPDYIQAHGKETPQRVGEISSLTGVPVIKAIKVRQRQDVEQALDFASVAEIVLFDAKAPQGASAALPGGNGEVFDWTLLKTSKLPDGFMLAGGLDESNIKTAMEQTDAAIFDVSSGVESAPGKKDATMIKKFIEAFRAGSYNH